MELEKPYIISVTGTKGKTTTVRMLNHVLQSSLKNILRVDTDGAFLDLKLKVPKSESSRMYSLLPTVAPGRFLYLLQKKQSSTAILETSIGSGTVYGMGYCMHNIGIFTNIFEDHIDDNVDRGIKNRSQLAQVKSKYIFKKIRPGGAAIFNADDKFVCSRLLDIRKDRDIKFIPVGYDFKYFDKNDHIKQGGEVVTVQDNFIGIENRDGFKKFIDINKITFTFDGYFRPSVYNVMNVFAGVYIYLGKKGLSTECINSFYTYKPHSKGKRLVLKNIKSKGIRVLIDFAHERVSLLEVSKLGKYLAKNKTIGVLRLAPDRSNKAIEKIGKDIANKFDHIIVFDKLDGISRGKLVGIKNDFTRDVGEVSTLLYNSIKEYKKNPENVYQILSEENALEKAFGIAEKGDIIVYIPGKSHELIDTFIKEKIK